MDVENEVTPQIISDLQTDCNHYNFDENSYIFLPSLKAEVDFQVKHNGVALTINQLTKNEKEYILQSLSHVFIAPPEKGFIAPRLNPS